MLLPVAVGSLPWWMARMVKLPPVLASVIDKEGTEQYVKYYSHYASRTLCRMKELGF